MAEPLRPRPGNIPDGGKQKFPLFPAQDATGASRVPDGSAIDPAKTARGILSGNEPAPGRRSTVRSGNPDLPVASLTPLPDEQGSDVSTPRRTAADSPANDHGQPAGGGERPRRGGGRTPNSHAQPAEPETVGGSGIKLPPPEPPDSPPAEMSGHGEGEDREGITPTQQPDLRTIVEGFEYPEASFPPEQEQVVVQHEPKPDKVWVADEITDPADWQLALGLAFDSIGYSFQGDLARAGEYMAELSRGISYVREHHPLGESERPRIDLVTNLNGTDPYEYLGSAFAASDTDNRVYVAVPYLEEYSAWNPDNWGTDSRGDGTVIFDGPNRVRFFMAGVEEARHIMYLKAQGNESEPIPRPTPLTVAEYDSIDIEYDALQVKRRVAHELNMPQETQIFLQERLDNATEVRRQRGEA